MSENNYCLEIAKRIYNLDTKVSEALGSELGRVFNGPMQQCISDLATELARNGQSYQLRGKIVLIANMARTIEDKSVNKAMMKEYNSILKEIKSHQTSFNSIDILNETSAALNESNFTNNTLKEGDHLIICISRSHGSAGADIGFALADKLHISYYDVDVLDQVLRHIESEKEKEWDEERSKNDPIYASAKNLAKSHTRARLTQLSLNHGLSKEDADFFNVSKLLIDMAGREDFVVIGRCADVILSNNNIPHISIYITAPTEIRAHRLMETRNIPTFAKALKQIVKIDKKHELYYHKFTGRIWGIANNYDLCINSSSYGIDEAVEVIKRLINR